ncbi:MAG: C-GCAxxG-C-C family protein [Treponema sp.]|nr:C-GCAxxG-C-C family protein [Treponema sp.]
MTLEETKERAVFYKHSGYNCAQAVVKALGEKLEIQTDQIITMTSGFAAGMGTMESTCGALVGANLMAGLKTDGKGTVGKARQLVAGFKQSSGALICKDLKGVGTGTVLCECDDCIRNAVEVFEKTFEIDQGL